ncbi:NPP1-like protein [Phytophthora palmivora]|uniref:NPP1-like protein n=1 Tax=Phytophthora palmivora TaxID=4796 RepID=A0A2P4YPU5_9STRA|nr:NPP1-like protein [Phytophthora palmivora]
MSKSDSEKSDSEYENELKLSPSFFVGYRLKGRRYNRTVIYGSNTSLRFQYELGVFGSSYLIFASFDGEYQDLTMWEQLTDAARGALNNGKNFGGAEVPFSDEHYEDHLEKAWLN